jgi:phospholipase/carboxylesterase
MSIFTSRLPSDYLLISPRGIFPSRLGGFSWVEDKSNRWPAYEEFLESTEALFGMLVLSNFPDADLDVINLLGFSQGAALAYTMALDRPSKVGKIAGISGFMPDKTDELVSSKPLIGKDIFVAHGKRDEMVPIEKANEVITVLGKGGARVEYCEEDVGHKLSASCFRGIETYFDR